MEELNMNKLTENELSAVDGGKSESSELKVRPIEPIWVEVTASSLNCRYTPSLNGKIIKTYEYGHKLKVDGITRDGKWYRTLVNDPASGGTIYGFVFKGFTENLTPSLR